MNKSLHILASLLTVLLCCFGCTPESLEKEPTMLELDKPEVRLTKDKGEMVVSVQTNEESVVAIETGSPQYLRGSPSSWSMMRIR